MVEDVHEERAVADLFGLSPTSVLFEQALTHPSFSHETPSAPHNQRLEFLGDAVLDFVVSDELFRRFPESDEGKLTRMRAQVVSTGALARFARHHHMGGALRFGKGASQNNLRDSENVLADAVEALIAAAYLCGGISSAQHVCRLVLDFGLSSLPEAGARDAKSDLQEKVQALGMKAPGYHVVGTRGPAHDAIFEVAVTAQGQTLAQGSGRSKRAAELQAAERALEGEAYKLLLAAGLPAEAEDS